MQFIISLLLYTKYTNKCTLNYAYFSFWSKNQFSTLLISISYAITLLASGEFSPKT